MPFFDGWEEFYKIFIVIEGKGWDNIVLTGISQHDISNCIFQNHFCNMFCFWNRSCRVTLVIKTSSE